MKTKEFQYIPTPFDSTNPIKVLDYVIGVIKENVSNTSYLSWSLISPLVIYWSTLIRLTSDKNRSKVGDYMLNH